MVCMSSGNLFFETQPPFYKQIVYYFGLDMPINLLIYHTNELNYKFILHVSYRASMLSIYHVASIYIGLLC